jgi:hypothetical protein
VGAGVAGAAVGAAVVDVVDDADVVDDSDVDPQLTVAIPVIARRISRCASRRQ